MAALEGKVAIVTGATSGIGERIAEVFVREGARVMAAGRRTAEGQALTERLGAACGFVQTNVADEDQVAQLVAHTVDRFGGLDVLVNNAGTSAQLTSIADLDITHFDAVLATNLRGLLLGMKHAARVMVPRRSGSIINIGSVAGSRGGFTGHPYVASKGAVAAVTRSAATELGEHGIRVNTISPGGIVTGIFAKNAGVEGAQADRVAASVKEVFAQFQPLPRAGETEDIARAAVFLASDAGSFVNGHDLVVDGGLSTMVMKWSDGIDMRQELTDRIRQAVSTA